MGIDLNMSFLKLGEDVKIMAVRMDHILSLTVAMPYLAKAIKSENHYFQLKASALQQIRKFIREQPHTYRRTQVVLNTLDQPGQGLKGMYLTLLGTSAEQGDSGQVGRGNRVCGVIAVNRPMSLEAAAGKNPVSHVGKIYNVLAHEMARGIHSQIAGIHEVTVWIVSTIGKPVNQPHVVSVQVGMKKGYSLKRISNEVQDFIKQELAHMEIFCQALAKGVYRIC